MNLQPIMRVVLCSALVALCVSGAELFSTQPVAGQETKPTALHGAAALEQLKQDGQYDSLQATMNQARFSVSRAEHTPLGRAAWHAPNPAAGYNAYVTEEGVSIAVNDQSYVSLSLHSLGYGAALQAVAPGEVSGDKQTITVTREGGVREWYVNGPDGLEQGFTLTEPPGARQAGVPLRLALQVSAGWRAVARDDGQQVTLRSAEGQAVEYSKLAVRDSVGRNIPARLTVAEEQIVIEVEDSEAAYPLTIDPLFSFQQKLLAADGAPLDSFGFAVALSGDTLVVGAVYDNIGANSDQGSAYVFTRSGTVWTFQQQLTAHDGVAYAYFGNSVALSGDTLVVGAWADSIGANNGQGSAYVFTRSGAVWTFQQKLTAYDGAYADFFGQAVALSGDTVVVGADGDDIGMISEQGSAYVFTRSGAVWTFQQKLTASDGEPQDYFGVSVALSGATLVVGAHFDDFNANTRQGSVYVFVLSGTVWTSQQKLTAYDGAKDDFFGWSVALSGNTLVAGAKYDDIGANSDQGSVYVFTRSGTDWMFQQKLTANDGAAYDLFGYSVALSGDILVVGAKDDESDANAHQGSAYVFTRIGANWTQQPKFTAYDGAPNDVFGYSVAISGNTMVVGAEGDTIGTNYRQGSVYVYVRPPCPTLTFAPASLPNGFSGPPYQQSLTVSGGAGPYQFALIGGALPPGMSLTSSGLLSGTPATLGAYHFTLSATDLSSFCSASRAYTLTIASCPTLTLDPPDIPNGAPGSAYSYTLAAMGGRKPYRFVVKGKLPPGLSLSADGVFSGTPTQTGYFTFTLLISDANGCASAWASSITITQSDIEVGVAPRDKGGSRRVVPSQTAARR